MSDGHTHVQDDDDTPAVGGQACCILEVCCGGQRQMEALAAFITQRTKGITTREATDVAKVLVANFDFAAKGTLVAFKRNIAENARKYKPDPGY